MLHCPRNFPRTLMVCGAAFTTMLGTAFAADPTGDWMVADQVANIRVAECNGSMWGVVVWEKTPGGRDRGGSVGRPSLQRQGRQALQLDDQARRFRQARDSGLPVGLSVRRRDLDPRCTSDSEQPFQQHGQGAAEGDQRNKDDRPARPTGSAENRCASARAQDDRIDRSEISRSRPEDRRSLR